MEPEIKVRATIDLLPTEVSGRSAPITSRYRPNHNFAADNNREMCIGEVELTDREWLHPGESAEVTITFLASPVLPKLVPGLSWRIQEGGRLVGVGTITQGPDR